MPGPSPTSFLCSLVQPPLSGSLGLGGRCDGQILCWIKVVGVGSLVLFQILVGRLSAFLHYYIGCGFVINGFYYVKVYSLYTHFDKGFLSWIDVGFCQMLFLHLLRWSCGFDFFIVVVNVMYDVDWFEYVEPSLWSWDESHLVMVCDLFYMLLDLVG